mgnify:CR=1 FL=1
MVSQVAYTSASQTYTGAVSKSNYQDITMQDFFTLLAAQLKNQNMLNPVEDTEFLSQMAQFSSLAAMQELSDSFSSLLSVSYIGKNIKAMHVGADGGTELIEGMAEKVEFTDSGTYVTVNGVRVSFDEITEISI